MEVRTPESLPPFALPTRTQAPAEKPAELPEVKREDSRDGDFRARAGGRRRHHDHDHHHDRASNAGRRIAMERYERTHEHDDHEDRDEESGLRGLARDLQRTLGQGLAREMQPLVRGRNGVDRETRGELRELGRELRTDLREGVKGDDFEAEAFLENTISALGEFATGLEAAMKDIDLEGPGKARHSHRFHHRAERIERRFEGLQSTLTELTSQLQSFLDALRADEDEVDPVPDVPVGNGDPIREPVADPEPTVAPTDRVNA